MRVSTKKIALVLRSLCLTMAFLLAYATVFAQKIDSTRVFLKPKNKVVNNLPQIKGSVQPYKPNTYGYYPSTAKDKNEKLVTILKIYPNPVIDQLNLSIRLGKETNISIKITDLLGNEIATLLNEKMPHGEQTKTFNIPPKLNSGIYFLRIVAGGEPIIKRISVL